MSSKARYTELDLLRSAAVLGMIVYHTAFDLQFLYDMPIDVNTGLWRLFQQTIAITFLLLVGISFAISWNRTDPEKRTSKFLKRGLIVFGCSMLVTLVTYIADPATYVRFGILHLIGVSILLLPFFAQRKRWNLEIALAILIAFHWTSPLRLQTILLMPLGFLSRNFKSIDYFPLIPWFGVVLLGFVIGQIFYVDHLHWRSRFPKPATCNLQPVKTILTFPGRYALMIYLVHQPIILLILWLMFR